VSEYQYYEFQALDKPLTRQQQKELRSLSSRAEITATSFVNEYNYGDFRGEPQKLMERYFDAFCYLANWGTRRLMFRLPKTVLDARTARRYCHSDAASVTETTDHVIIDLCLDRDPDDEWLEGSGLLAGMVQARSDLAAGDLRLLYLAWLLGIQRADEEDDDFEDETEPPVPAGLGELSAPLEAIADFLEIYEDCWPWPPRQARKPQSPSPTHWPRGFSLSRDREGHAADDARQRPGNAGTGAAAPPLPRHRGHCGSFRLGAEGGRIAGGG
jgi:hypothetical protein